jgi:hypothetical protein
MRAQAPWLSLVVPPGGAARAAVRAPLPSAGRARRRAGEAGEGARGLKAARDRG